MLRKTFLLITILALLTGNFAVNPLNSSISTDLSAVLNKPLVMVIVNSSIYTAIESSLNQYAVDVENEGSSVNITETNQLSDKTPKGIREYLRDFLNRGLTGVLFVGDIPEAWYELGDKKFPTDMYYRDLNGLWKDMDGDGIYEEHGGDVSPEIWVGRLKASTLSGDEVSLIKNYFTKNHRYRDGSRILPLWRTLLYIDDEGVNWTEESERSLNYVSTDITLVTDPEVTNAENYKSRLMDPFGYQWVYLMCHGSFDYQAFMEQGQPKAGTIYSWEYRSIDPRVFFYLFFSCSAARYTEREYFGGSAVFADTYGLLAIGSTDLMFSVSFREFFAALSDGKSIGTAFQEWFLKQIEGHDQLQEEQYQSIFYGLTMIGDPTLKPYAMRSVQLHDISITDVTTRFLDAKNKETLLIIVTVENRGNFTESFDLTIRASTHLLTSFHLSLAAKANTTVDVTVAHPYSIVFVNNLETMITATASIVPEEFNQGDNVKSINIKGMVIILRERYSSWYPAASLFLILAMFIVIPYGLLRLLMSERLIIIGYLKRTKSDFARKPSSLEHKPET